MSIINDIVIIIIITTTNNKMTNKNNIILLMIKVMLISINHIHDNNNNNKTNNNHTCVFPDALLSGRPRSPHVCRRDQLRCCWHRNLNIFIVVFIRVTCYGLHVCVSLLFYRLAYYQMLGREILYTTTSWEQFQRLQMC